jgi:hypothetical protein
MVRQQRYKFERTGDGKIKKCSFRTVSPGKFFMHEGEIFMKTFEKMCVSFKHYDVDTLPGDTNVSIISEISFE